MNGWTLDYLADHPAWVPVLAKWHHAEWGRITRDWPLATAAAELAEHRGHNTIPTTIVALQGGELLGSASLLAEDMPDQPPFTPWLASVYVIPARRGHGLGGALVRRIQDEARRLGVGALYLFTTEAERYYSARGWRTVQASAAGGVPGAIMSYDLTRE